MKKALTITILSVFTFSKLAICQDNNTLAQDAYLKAEAYVLQNDLDKSLIELSNAEKYLGETNSKILYLKINVLKSQFMKKPDSYQMLKSSIAKFFSITNKDIYPSEKYLEIVRVHTDLIDFVQNDSIESHHLKNSGSLSKIKSYLKSTPNTFYYTILDQKRDSLETIENQEGKRLLELKEIKDIDKRLEQIESELSDAPRKNFHRFFWPSLSLASTGAFVYYISQKNEQDFIDKDLEKSDFITGGVVTGLIGSFLIAAAMPEVYVKKLKKERDTLLFKKRLFYYSVKPFYINSFRTDVAGLKLNVSF